YLSPSRVLLDMQQQSIKQSAAISRIGPDIADRFGTAVRSQLREALAVATKDEREAQANFVKHSATMIEQMSSGFGALQATLERVVQDAKTGTTEQIRAGTEHAERLSALVEGHVARVNDSTRERHEQLDALLVAVTQRSSELDRAGRTLVE